MCLDEVAHDGEAETEAAVGPGLPSVLLAEAVEDVGQEIGLDAHAGVGHTDSPSPLGRVDGHGNASPFGSELDGVGQQVRDHLLQPHRVTRYGRQRLIELDLKLQVFLLGGGANRVDGSLDDRREDRRPEAPS